MTMPAAAPAAPQPMNGAASHMPMAPSPVVESGSGGSSGDDASLMAQARAVLEGAELPPEDGAEKPAAEAKPEPEKKVEEPKKDGKPDGWTEEEASKSWARLKDQDGRLKARAAEHTENVRKFDADKTAFAQEREAFGKERSAWQERVAKAKQSPLVALQELGWSVAQLTKYIADNGAVPPEKLAADLKLEYEGGLKELREKQAKLEEELKAKEEAGRTAEQKRLAAEYEVRARQEVDAYLQHYGDSHFPNLKVVPRQIAQQKALDIQEAHFMRNRAAIEAGQENPLAIADAMAYAERELATIYGWKAGSAGQAGTGNAGKPGAAKPETSPLSPADLSSRAVTPPPAEDDDIDEEKLRAKALKVLSGELPPE